MITCTFEDGKQVQLRHIAVGVIVCNKDRTKLLLVKRSSSSYIEPGKYDIPGGFMDYDETSVSTAKREVKEETGHDVRICSLLCINDVPVGKRPNQNVELIYIAEAEEGEITHDEEVDGAEWFSIRELPAESSFVVKRYDDISLFIENTKKEIMSPVIRGI